MSALESRLQSLLFLEAPKRLSDLRLHRRNVGVARRGRRVITFGIKGQCDIYGYWRGGLATEIELKSKRGALSDDQKAWRDYCLEWEIPWVALWALRNESEEQTVDRWLTTIGGMRR